MLIRVSVLITVIVKTVRALALSMSSGFFPPKPTVNAVRWHSVRGIADFDENDAGGIYMQTPVTPPEQTSLIPIHISRLRQHTRQLAAPTDAFAVQQPNSVEVFASLEPSSLSLLKIRAADLESESWRPRKLRSSSPNKSPRRSFEREIDRERKDAGAPPSPDLEPQEGTPDALDLRAAAWLSANGLQRAATPAEVRARQAKGEETDVATYAEAAAWRACDLALAAQPVDEGCLFDEAVLETARSANAARHEAASAARTRLSALGLCEEHLELARRPGELIPLLHEMAYARYVGGSNLAKRRQPPAASFGKEIRWPTTLAASQPLDAESALITVVVARRSGEDVSWLTELPHRVNYHVMHVGEECSRLDYLAARQQTLLRPAQLAELADVRIGGGGPSDIPSADRSQMEDDTTTLKQRRVNLQRGISMKIDKRKGKNDGASGSQSPVRSPEGVRSRNASPRAEERGRATVTSPPRTTLRPPANAVRATARMKPAAGSSSLLPSTTTTPRAAGDGAPLAPAEGSPAAPATGMAYYSPTHAFLAYLLRASENEELIELLKDPIERERRVLVVSTERDDVDESIQYKIVAALRKQAQRVMDLFKKWDVDKSGTVDREEFRRALRTLKIPGTDEEIDMLHASWDADGGGTIEYGEILKALHAGRRYDQLRKRKADPPIPPGLVFVHANPFASNPRFFDDLELLVRAATSGRPLPRFLPLGKWRCGERLVHSDPSGAPHSATLLPIAAAWRAVFGCERPLPLWLAHTPGGCFAISRDAALHPCCQSRKTAAKEPAATTKQQGTDESAVSFYKRVISECGVECQVGGVPDPIAGHAFERLWRAVFEDDSAS